VLDEPASRALPMVAAFRHGVDLEAVAVVAGLEVDRAAAALAAWQAHGLVTADGDGRWRLPAAVRDAAWRLARAEGTAGEATARRRDFLLAVVAPWGLAAYGLDGPGAVASIGPWAPELAHLGTEALAADDLDLLAKVSEGRYWYWDAAGRIAEGDAWFRQVVAAVDRRPDHPAAPCLLTMAATFGPTVARMAARADLVRRAHEAAVAADDEAARVLSSLAVAAQLLWTGDRQTAEGLLCELAARPPEPWPFIPVTAEVYRGVFALAIGETGRAVSHLTLAHHRFAELGSAFGEQVALLFLARAELAQGASDRALACYRAAEATARHCAVGHRPDHARIGQAELLHAEGRDVEAREAYERAVVGRLEARDHPAAADCLCGLAEIDRAQGATAAAAAGSRHALLLAWRARDRAPLVRAVVGLAELALDRDDPAEAARIIGALDPPLPAGGRPPTGRDRSRVEAVRSRLADRLGDAATTPAAEGAAGGLEGLVARSGVLAAVERG
jgi:tetratricopeptide (TPR) repeat protein